MSVGDTLEQWRADIAPKVRAKGWEPGMYQAVWRGAQGTQDNWEWANVPIDKFDMNDCMLAVLDALLNQGSITAWPGDGTSCVCQMIELAYKDRDYWRDRARAAEGKKGEHG